MTDDKPELEALRARVAELEAANAEKDQEIAAANRRSNRLSSMLARAQVIEYGLPRDYPSPTERDALLRICLAAYPSLSGRVAFDQLDKELPEFRTSFYLSFWAGCWCFGRRDKPDRNWDMLHWRDAAENWLQKQAYNDRLALGAFNAAIIAHGFVHTSPQHPQNYLMTAGLTVGGAGAYEPKRWRQMLETGRVPTPAEIEGLSAQGPPVRIVQMAQVGDFQPGHEWWR